MKTATEVRVLQSLPLLVTKGFVIHPPIKDLALEAGDMYSFTYGWEEIYAVFDGNCWRFLHANPSVGSRYDFDPDVVTVL